MNRELVRIDPVTEAYILDTISTSGSAGVDILVLVDNSHSMGDEQALLARNFPELIRSLLQPVDAVNNNTGDPVPDGKPDHVPIKDMHIGVVSSDMGTDGYPAPDTGCTAFGDDGKLQNIPNPNVNNCDSVYPKYLSYVTTEPPPVRGEGEPATAEIEKLANDFGCIATLGINGCGFEQQMEAVLKALTVHMEDGVNTGFLRSGTILAVLFMTDEEDCSVDSTNPENLRIFDPALKEELGPMERRCTLHEEMVYNVDRYVEGFSRLRENVEDFVIGMIVGVPSPDIAPECNGFIGEIDPVACLARDDMQAVPDPNNNEMMKQSCVSTDPTKGAYPPRRFITLAQKFLELSPETLGENVYIHSICTEDYSPAITAITNKIHEIADTRTFHRQLQLKKDPSDPRGCICEASCSIIESLMDTSDCKSPKTNYDGNGDTFPDIVTDNFGTHRLCEVPHSKMTISAQQCSCCLTTTPENPGTCVCELDCTSPDAKLIQRMCGDQPCPGWWYDPFYDPDGPEKPEKPAPTIIFTGVEPEAGSTMSILCRSIICPTMRQCGYGRCCHESEYCFTPQDGEPMCLIREDICQQYGNDLWCPYEINGLPQSYQGICCLDMNFDGMLEIEDRDNDTLPETPSYRCDGSRCVERAE